MNEQTAVYGVHAAHCCHKHGCKYGAVVCPVENGAVKQEFPCEYCDEEANEENETVDAIVSWLLERVRQIQAGSYPDEESALNMEQRAHHYDDVIRGIRERAWKS
jgi:hypothetical protein